MLAGELSSCLLAVPAGVNLLIKTKTATADYGSKQKRTKKKKTIKTKEKKKNTRERKNTSKEQKKNESKHVENKETG